MLGPDRGDVYAVGGRIFYKIAKNHHLVDGNKRSAVICTYLFFFKNHIRLDFPAFALYALAKEIVESPKGSEALGLKLRDTFRRFSESDPNAEVWLNQK